MQYKMASRLS